MPVPFNKPASRSRYLELAGVIGLVGLTVLFLAMSWRKWPDPLIDFGRELYIPWKLSQGAVLYRDVDDVYGPLSQYFNSILFRCVGPSLMVLVTANILIFIGILASIYVLFRRAWGIGAALAAAALFITIFGFSEFNWVGNFNYAAPYSHETTHGMLLCLLLVIVLVRWVKNATPGASFLAGILFGLTWVIKPEIMLAGGVTLVVAILAKYRSGPPPSARDMAIMGIGTILPTLGFVFYFAAHMPWGEAVYSACRGWLIVTSSADYTDNVLQRSFLGIDDPWKHLWEQALASLFACLLIALIAGVAWLTDRIAKGWIYFTSIGLFAGGLVLLSIYEITWPESGRCLPGLMLIYLVISLKSLWAEKHSEGNHHTQLTRLLVAALATALLARMILNARIYQFGYYQAALAAIMVPAVLMGELPTWIGVGRKGTMVIIIGTLALLVPGAMLLSGHSLALLSMKTLPVGTDGDQFYALPPQIEPMGTIVNKLSEALGKTEPNQTVLVLPEGEMINYLARRPSPLAPFFYFSFATGGGRENKIVDELKLHPPDWVVIVSRDLREYGVERWGDQPGEGQLILQWVHANYETAASLGGDPLDNRQRGAVIFRRKMEVQ